MKNIFEISILDLIPESMKKDPKIVAVCHAIDQELQKLSYDIKQTIHIPRIDELPESVLDLLAWQYHVDFYEPSELDIQTKRELIRRSIEDHRIKGTPAAVERLFQNIFNGGKIEEWFEYGGEPYHFKITALGRQLANEQQIREFRHALDSMKNVRSWLDGVEVSLEYIINLYLALMNWTVVDQKFKLAAVKDQDGSFTITQGFLPTVEFSQLFKNPTSIKLPDLKISHAIFNQSYSEQKFFADPKDMPEHDLRSTALLDLLLVGLGIVREGNSRPIEYFFEHFVSNWYLGLWGSNEIQYHARLPTEHKSQMMINPWLYYGRNDRRTFKNPTAFENQLALSLAGVMHQTISQIFKDFEPDFEPISKQSFRFDLPLNVALPALSNIESQFLNQSQDLHSTLKQNLAAVFGSSILQKFKAIDTITPAEEIQFRYWTKIFFAMVSNALKVQSYNDRIATEGNLGLSIAFAINSYKQFENRIPSNKFFDRLQSYAGIVSSVLQTSTFRAVDDDQSTSKIFYYPLNIKQGFAAMNHISRRDVMHEDLSTQQDLNVAMNLAFVHASNIENVFSQADSHDDTLHDLSFTYYMPVTHGVVPSVYSEVGFSNSNLDFNFATTNTLAFAAGSSSNSFFPCMENHSTLDDIFFNYELTTHFAFSNVLSVYTNFVNKNNFANDLLMKMTVAPVLSSITVEKYNPVLNPSESYRLDLHTGFLISEAKSFNYPLETSAEDLNFTGKINLYQTFTPVCLKDDRYRDSLQFEMKMIHKPAIVSHTFKQIFLTKQAPWDYEESLDLAHRTRTKTKLRIFSRRLR